MQDARNEIEERKKTEARLRILSRATEQSPVSVIVTDRDAIIEYVNPRFCEMTGYSTTEAVGKNAGILKSGLRSEEDTRAMWESILSGEDWHGEFQNKKKTGELYWARASISAIQNAEGAVTEFVAVQEDVTDQRYAAQELQEAKEQAEAANRAKSDFLANMSHEIRTPMNAVMGMSHLALQTDLTPRQKKYLQQIDRSARNLLQIINDILDFSKIEAGQMDLEQIPFELSEVYEHVMGAVGGIARKKDLELILHDGSDIPPRLIGDPLRLGQVLVNLLSNAIKFTEQGDVSLLVDLVHETEAQIGLRFSVKDSGIGMTEEQTSKLFRSFQQADASTTRKYGGTGLGLVISQKLVGKMGGQIEVDSVLGVGSTFSFTAVFERSEDDGPPRWNAGSRLQGLRILLVDDHPLARNVIEQMLASLSFDVTAVERGEEVVPLLRQAQVDQHPYRLVLMDWKLTDMDGLQVADLIHEEGGLTTPPRVILISGHQEVELLLDAYSVIDGFIMKPLSRSSLLNAVQVAFGSIAQGPRHQEKDASFRAVGDVHVLLAEDNEINQDLASELLRLIGIRVTVVGNGQQAVDAVQSGHYDLILTDVQMPVMDGYEAARRIRAYEAAHPDDQSVPIIALTALAMKDDELKSLQSGMSDHLLKPIDPQELYHALYRWLPEKIEPVGVEPAELGADPLKTLSIDGLDVQAGLRFCGERPELYLDMLKNILRDYSGFSDEMKQVAEAKDWKEISFRMHKIKSLLGVVGAARLQAAAEAIEVAPEEGGMGLLNEFEMQFDPFIQRLRSALGPLAEGEADAESGEPEGSDHELLNLLLQLRQPLRDASPVQVKKLVEALESRPWPRIYREDLTFLAEQVSSYRFDLARKILEQLINKYEEERMPDE
jgi:PAS domain S-box-containing protein